MGQWAYPLSASQESQVYKPMHAGSWKVCRLPNIGTRQLVFLASRELNEGRGACLVFHRRQNRLVSAQGVPTSLLRTRGPRKKQPWLEIL
jgi:hypothetical protein